MKKRTLTRVISYILALIIFLNMVCVMNVSAETTGITAEGLMYEITNEEVTITDYIGSATELTIPAAIEGYTVTSIGFRAFSECNSLQSVIIPDGVTSIEGWAFYGCTNLYSIIIPESVTSIKKSAFEDTAYHNDERNWENGVLYIGPALVKAKDTISGSCTIKDCTTLIAGCAFYECTAVTNITIPESVMNINYDAFYGCKSLSSINIPDSVTSIENEVFYGCKTLSSILIPKGVTSIGSFAFSGCTALSSVTIPDSVTSIDGWAFYECTNLQSINIPDSVTSIGSYAFSNCTSLHNITIPEHIASIGNFAFDGTAYCNDESNWENGVLYMGFALVKAKNTISGSYAVKNNTILIAGSAFYKCEQLSSITIPKSISNIGSIAFSGCSSLENIAVDEDNLVYDSRDNCNAIIDTATNTLLRGCKNTVIPSGVTNIGDCAFSDCYSLESITIPQEVTSIGGSAFSDCLSLGSITIPSNMTSIGGGAFYDCENLTDVYYSGTKEQWDEIDMGFDNDDLTDATIHFEFEYPEPETTVPATEPETAAPVTAEPTTQETDSTEAPTQKPTQATDPTEKPTQKPTQKPTAPVETKPVVTEPVTTEPVTTTPADTQLSTTEPEEITIPEDFITDEKTNISVVGETDAELVVSEITSDKQIEDIDLILIGEKVSNVFDITLQKDGAEVQPNGNVSVYIPSESSDSKVYRMETDGTLTDMNAVYKDGYLIFITEHFSIYVVTEKSGESTPPEETYLLGDANGDGKVNVKDATQIQKAAASLVNLDEEQAQAADVNGDGKVNVKDATAIQKFVAGIPVDFPIGE